MMTSGTDLLLSWRRQVQTCYCLDVRYNSLQQLTCSYFYEQWRHNILTISNYMNRQCPVCSRNELCSGLYRIVNPNWNSWAWNILKYIHTELKHNSFSEVCTKARRSVSFGMWCVSCAIIATSRSIMFVWDTQNYDLKRRSVSVKSLLN
jgi:hypothetical protein